jgi:hypothetical protein
MAAGLSGSASPLFIPSLSLSLGSPRVDSPLSPFIDAHEAELLDQIAYEPIPASIEIRMDRTGRYLRLFTQMNKINKIASKVIGKVEMEIGLRLDRSHIDFPRGVADLSKFIQELVLLSGFSFGDSFDEAIANPEIVLTMIQHGEEFYKIRTLRPLESALEAARARSTSPLFSSPFSLIASDIEELLTASGHAPELIERFKEHITHEDSLAALCLIQELEKKGAAKTAEDDAAIRILLEIITIKEEINSEKHSAANSVFSQVFRYIKEVEAEFDTIEMRFKTLA